MPSHAKDPFPWRISVCGPDSMKAASIRSHLLLLVLALSVPLISYVGFEIYAQRQQAVDHTKSALRMLAKTMASNTGDKIASAELTLARLAVRPQVRKVDPQACDSILGDLLALNPDYSNVATTTVQGKVACSAVVPPGGKHLDYAQNPAFQHFLKSRRFDVSQPFPSPSTGKWVSVLSTPIWNDQHELVGGVHIPMDVKAFDPKIPTQHLPDGSRYGFFRDDGIMVWRNLDPEGVIGKRPDAEAARQIVKIRDGEFESLAVDGITRFFSVVPMPEVGWVAFVGVPVSVVYAEANRRALTTAVIALLSITLLGILAIAMARWIAQPIAALAHTARLVHRGDLGARAIVAGPREVQEVANAFNAMTDSLQSASQALEAEIAERKEIEVQMRDMAFHDPLTGLPNRLLLHDRMSQLMAASVRGGFFGALMFLDLDDFKPLNDTHGHEVGDQLLKEAADRLTRCVRQMDTVARFGGDEFVVMLGELHADRVQSMAQAHSIAEKIRVLLAAPYLLTICQEGQTDRLVEHRCSASIGVVLFSTGPASQADILKWADAAMYQSKKAGGNTVRFSDAVD
ncbi:MAG: GGDEF domain-containing protein [Rhodoferax sp.]|nr:GGDEF domain-containing protein [Rhodoferax sp.]